VKRTLLAGIALLAAALVPGARAGLHLQVITSSPEGFSVNSTLVYGDRDAILIDTQFLLSEAHREVAAILESKRNLIAVYVTHPHPDHYFGLAVIKQAFPNARLVALPATVAGMKAGWDTRARFWASEYGGNLPPTGPILPDELPGGTPLVLEGEELRIIGGVVGDAPNNSYVWIPSLKAVVAGDTVFSATHFTPPKSHYEWFKTLDEIAALQPEIVVPGHQIAGAVNDASTLAFMKRYMEDYEKALASSKSAEEFRAKVKQSYPDLGLERLLVSSSEAAFPAKK
jgi:glyoxylase-like metal-dependent hydrolase (beta-lactamase superfamily II)